MATSDETAVAPAIDAAREADIATSDETAVAPAIDAATENKNESKQDVVPAGACTLCRAEKSIVWRCLKESKERVCNRCYLEKFPRPALNPDDAITGQPDVEARARAKARDVKSEPSVSSLTRIKAEPTVQRVEDSFPDASQQDHAEIAGVLDGFAKWLEQEHHKAELTARNYKGKVLKSFRTNAKAISCMASEEYRAAFQHQGDAVWHTALNQFARYYLGADDLVRKGPIRANAQEIIKPEVKLEPTKPGFPLQMKEELKAKPKQEEPQQSVKLNDEASDTEYPEVDLLTFPAKIRIEESGLKHKKMDGVYVRLPLAHRGRPAYSLQEGEKEVFMYWRKSNWMLSLSLGSSKSLAKVQDKEVCRHPCEPYPYQWSVFHKDAHDFFEAHGLRAVDVESEAKTSAVKPLPKEPNMAGAVAASPHRVKRHKAEKDQEKALAKAEKKAEKMAEKVAKEDASPAAAKPAEGEAEKPASPGNASVTSPKPASEALASSSSEDSDSDSESDSSSSESGASSGGPAAAPKTSPVAPALPPAAAAGGFNAQKAKVFEGKIRHMLKQLKTPAECQQKLGMFAAQPKPYMLQSTLTREQLMELKDKLVKEFVTDAAEKMNATPSAEQMPAAPLGLPSGPQGLPSAPHGTELPVTPPDDTPLPAAGDALPHRQQGLPLPRSVLKRPMLPRGGFDAKRIRLVDTVPEYNQPLINLEHVENYRAYLDTLWFQAPGALVACDRCGHSVSQANGSLQGAGGRSQFAQDTFWCTNCMAT